MQAPCLLRTYKQRAENCLEIQPISLGERYVRVVSFFFFFLFFFSKKEQGWVGKDSNGSYNSDPPLEGYLNIHNYMVLRISEEKKLSIT
ncbi:hypothetical protein ACKS23_03740 [Histoplasma ohiense]